VKSILLILALGSFGIAAEPGNDPFAPKAATDEFVLKRDGESQSPVPEEFASKNEVSIRVESIQEDGIVFMLINNTDKALHYYGTEITSPWFRLQIPWKRGELREADLMRWCGTGLYLPKILARRCCYFKVATKEPKFRVGLDFWPDDRIQDDRKTTVWSDVVNKNGEPTGAPNRSLPPFRKSTAPVRGSED